MTFTKYIVVSLLLIPVIGLLMISLAFSQEDNNATNSVRIIQTRRPEAASSDNNGPNFDGSLVPSWNSNGPYFTFFDLDTPQILPNVAPFPPGVFISAGEYVNGASYMVDRSGMIYKVNDNGVILDQYMATLPPGDQIYSGLALDPSNGMFFASSTNDAASTLFTFDVFTGNSVQIGPISGAPAIIAMAIDGAGNLFGLDRVLDSFMQIDQATGTTSNAVALPFDANFNQGMGYDPATGLLFILGLNNDTFNGELWTVDTSNPSVPVFTFIGLLGETIPGGTNQLTWGGTVVELIVPTATIAPTPTSVSITPTPTAPFDNYLPGVLALESIP